MHMSYSSHIVYLGPLQELFQATSPLEARQPAANETLASILLVL